MRTNRLFAVALLLPFVSTLAGAKVEPPPKPDPGLGHIGISVKVRPPAKMGARYAETVYFVKLADDGDAAAADAVIESNYAHKQQVYLLNATPGRYVAVASEASAVEPMVPRTGPRPTGVSVDIRPSRDGKFTTLFSQELISLTQVTVGAGGLAFMGQVVVSTTTKLAESDPAQAHYASLIRPQTAQKGKFAQAFSGDILYRGSPHESARDAGVEREFWSVAAEKSFADSPEWFSLINRRLGELAE